MTPHLTLRKLPYAFKVAADVQAVGPARRLVREVVESLGLGQQAPSSDDLELLAGELIANAVVHTEAPCVVCLQWTGRRVRVEVTDADVREAEAKAPPPCAEHGRGLLLVDMLAAAWGSQPCPAGKTTWFELAVPAAGESSASAALSGTLEGVHCVTGFSDDASPAAAEPEVVVHAPAQLEHQAV
ncbi:ATP-binding protein [Streptomyces alanosinicus]|uniref:ATP-binding protein n=1 Tax=Streptomyces alanosinicus TaxID=68171 RepID=A0A918IP33_9ACTN|nr:ATP-binding protein [Streptomyces alanosinicus]GGW25216.1 ATP-binding protein [Streptomyces alanosinicus]